MDRPTRNLRNAPSGCGCGGAGKYEARDVEQHEVVAEVEDGGVRVIRQTLNPPFWGSRRGGDYPARDVEEDQVVAEVGDGCEFVVRVTKGGLDNPARVCRHI